MGNEKSTRATKGACLVALAAFLSNCGTFEPYDSIDAIKANYIKHNGPENVYDQIELKGQFTKVQYFSGKVIAFASDGETVEAPVSEIGGFSVQIPINKTFFIAFVAPEAHKGVIPESKEIKIPHLSQVASVQKRTASILRFHSGPSLKSTTGRLKVPESTNPVIDLGYVMISSGKATPEHNPLFAHRLRQRR